MEAEAENPDFGFLFELASPAHAYYRWRLHSLAEGDGLRSWRTEPYVMVAGGQRWRPPAMRKFRTTWLDCRRRPRRPPPPAIAGWRRCSGSRRRATLMTRRSVAGTRCSSTS